MRNPRTKILFTVLNYHQRRLSRLSVSEARQYFEKISHTRIKPKIRHIYEKRIDSQGQPITLRIYEGSLNKPTIMYFHGGGFVVGSVDSHDVVARYLCKATGSTVVSVGYRLAPEHPSPAAIEDGLSAVRWLLKSKLNSNFILSGDSAGGQIAVMVALSLHKPQRQLLLSQILMYPALDPTLTTASMQKFARGFFVSKKNMQDFWAAYRGQCNIEWPLKQAQLKMLPPTLIQTADYDILKDEAFEFFKKLQAAGVEAEYHNYKATAHGLMQMPNFVSKRGQALRDITEFVSNH